MKQLTRVSIILFFLFSLAGLFPHLTHADPPDELDYDESYNRAKVLQVVNQGMQDFQGAKTYNETLKVQFLEGNEKNKIVTISYSTDATFGIQQKIGNGATVVVDSKPDTTGKMYYSIYEPYRVTNLWWLLGGFALLIFAVVGKKGIGALIGLAISVLVIIFYIIPQILKGLDPLTICIIGAIVILFVTTYVAHGVSLKTTVALIGTAASLIIAGFLSTLSVQLTYLLGISYQSSDYVLQLSAQHLINPQGLFLGGILIGTLGALNDITTTQSITVFTLAKENPTQKISHLFWKSLHIGREHIISMINTLVLAYAGSSFAVFLFFSFNPANLPWWLLLNDETTMEEIVRTFVGSAALILAVPITTILASWVSLNREKLFGKIVIKWS
jgi:uncharacterized membrane protein